jgi:hypothetical protein
VRGYDGTSPAIDFDDYHEVAGRPNAVGHKPFAIGYGIGIPLARLDGCTNQCRSQVAPTLGAFSVLATGMAQRSFGETDRPASLVPCPPQNPADASAFVVDTAQAVDTHAATRYVGLRSLPSTM